MKLLKRDEEMLRVRVQHEDDLWVLSQLSKGGKLAGMVSHRRDSTTGTQEGGRAKSAERKPMWIVIGVENSEFQPFSDHLRLHGVITEAPVDKGSYHTHTVGLKDEVELTATSGWTRADEQLLQEAVKEGGRAKAAIIVVETDEIQLFEIASHGMRDLSLFTLRGGGKREAKSAQVRDGFLVKVAKETALLFGDELPLIICGPGLTRVQFGKLLVESGCNQKMLNVATSIGGRPAANEVLALGLGDELLGDTAIVEQTKAVEEALARLSTDGAVAYGPDSIRAALEAGAIDKLIVLADLLRDEEATIGDETWYDFVRRLDDTNSTLVQASTEHDAGLQLEGMGGALALLRWKLD
jgi:mRNA surveillance protein pelota